MVDRPPDTDEPQASPDSEDEPVDVRARILHAATVLFGRQGYSATSVREVVASAGVTKPTLYYYFANKEALFAETVNVQFDQLQILIGRLTDPEVVYDGDADGWVASRMKRFLEAFVLGAIDNPEKVRLMMTATAPTDTSQPKVVTVDRFLSELDRLREIFEIGIQRGELRSDIDIDVVTSLLAGAADFWMMRGMSCRLADPVEQRPDPFPADFPDSIVSTILRGLT